MYKPDELDIRSKSNVRENGEVFTPSHIVKKMTDLIPKESWSDPEYCFLEPSCGNGQFLVEIFKRRIDCGISIENTLNTMIGMDITCQNISESHFRLYELACSQMIVEGIKPKSKEWFVKACAIIAIATNNIFTVKDSIEYINSGKLNDRKFFFEDPTPNNQVLDSGTRKNKMNKIGSMILKCKKTKFDPKLSIYPFFKNYDQ